MEDIFYFSSLNPNDLRKMQLKLVNILEVFDEFCHKHGLTYYLAAGTALGAVRHNGFIPWDDDLDVSMPRDDFEKLFELWNNENNRYQLVRPDKNTITGVHIGLLRDSNTTCIYEYATEYDICHGMKIDIEVLDGCPDSKLAQKVQRFFCKIYGILSAQRLPHGGGKGRKIIGWLSLNIIRSKSVRYKLFKFAENQVKKYKIEECNKVRICYWKIADKELFAKPIYHVFEGKRFPLPNQYDRYLKLMYKNYMEKPPIEEQKPHTFCFFYDPDHPYIDYKGIKYCVKNQKV